MITISSLLLVFFWYCAQWRIHNLAKGGEPQPEVCNEFLRLSHKKTLILAPLFTEKGHAVSAVTTDNAKICSQFMSKSRSLTKVRERRLQPGPPRGGGQKGSLSGGPGDTGGPGVQNCQV